MFVLLQPDDAFVLVMRSAFRKQEPRYPNSWQDLPGGSRIHCAVSEVCNTFAQRIFGYYFVKLGNLSSQVALHQCQIRQQFGHTKNTIETTSLIGHSHNLPFQENSIDGFLLANELDFAQDPHQVLREVDRTITGSGYVIISGFNPFSLAGLIKYMPIKQGSMLKDARFFTSSRIKDWLNLLGFEVIEQQNVLFSTLFLRTDKFDKTRNNWMERHMPWCGSVYVILARKREFPMSIIKPKWKLKPRFSPVGASMHTQHRKQR